MANIILFHGTPNKIVTPTFGLGEDRHDYGRGFYLTEDFNLAKEWAVCRPDKSNGWVHTYILDMSNLKVLDFQQLDVLVWLAELMKHRAAADSKRYRLLSARFIDKYGTDTSGNGRDSIARRKMKELIDSDANKITNVFSTLLER